jgi:hypothetical protein
MLAIPLGRARMTGPCMHRKSYTATIHLRDDGKTSERGRSIFVGWVKKMGLDRRVRTIHRDHPIKS